MVSDREVGGCGALALFLAGASIEVTPRTAARIADFRPLLPAGTRVYIAHVEGTPFEDVLATAIRLRREGFEPMPHIPARLVANRATLEDRVARLRGEAGVTEALILGGGASTPAGSFGSAMELLETGAFDGFRRLHVAGHPEGNPQVAAPDPERVLMEALAQKQAFAAGSGVEMAIVTQFCFDPAPVLAWARRIAAAGIALPIHVGAAGPARLPTLLKYAVSCGIGPSIGVLKRRGRDLARLVAPFEPDALLTELALCRTEAPNIAGVHLFPLGGIIPAADWLTNRRTADLR